MSNPGPRQPRSKRSPKARTGCGTALALLSWAATVPSLEGFGGKPQTALLVTWSCVTTSCARLLSRAASRERASVTLLESPALSPQEKIVSYP